MPDVSSLRRLSSDKLRLYIRSSISNSAYRGNDILWRGTKHQGPQLHVAAVADGYEPRRVTFFVPFAAHMALTLSERNTGANVEDS